MPHVIVAMAQLLLSLSPAAARASSLWRTAWQPQCQLPAELRTPLSASDVWLMQLAPRRPGRGRSMTCAGARET